MDEEKIVEAFGEWLDAQVDDLSRDAYDAVLVAIADEVTSRRACVREEREIEGEA